MFSSNNFIELRIEETDGISCIRFCKTNSDYLAFSTWDGSLHTYDIKTKRLLKTFKFDCPQLACEWAEHTCVSGGADGAISANGKQIGSHNDAVSCLAYSLGSSQIISSSFDKTVKTWDLRSPNPISELSLQDKVYSVSTLDEYSVICGCGDQNIFTFDTRRPEKGKVTKSPLHYNISCVAATKDLFAIGSFEGRVGVSDTNNNTFTFKAHYQVEDDSKLLYSINSMCFNPQTRDLVTAGSDGKIIVWDIEMKKQRYELGPYETSISSIDFSANGNILATAISYGYENGNISHPKDRVLLFICI
ncbi:mitotic checkpoint protein, putative [Trichomonas vaginalis G3]|uniref:Mitotic checkpoint protein, putative n=1 Tax=Trichomonas vaginalis (strain ATCC PRA-98 / G3) TaxID=412133 RepID=A2FQM9_TRIV3|nr:spindle assembly checkpoint [Trichomonas vaginalis G3]EAX92804.1 mitotic checkpoint protein, putative [Trichomonas vaginalis G3]KAI5483732.1 spindle assembly checkpoint [Trichomonas vaginalis G3]|eukprot:XP_001305734.1 mitotic checkpoint protein [Trichomonas vaginalis G3]